MLFRSILDKTGTITRGEPALTDVVVAQGQAETEVLRLAASLERGSEHPLGEAIVKGAEARIRPERTLTRRKRTLPSARSLSRNPIAGPTHLSLILRDG